jgi:hypothetical protein
MISYLASWTGEGREDSSNNKEVTHARLAKTWNMRWNPWRSQTCILHRILCLIIHAGDDGKKYMLNMHDLKVVVYPSFPHVLCLISSLFFPMKEEQRCYITLRLYIPPIVAGFLFLENLCILRTRIPLYSESLYGIFLICSTSSKELNSRIQGIESKCITENIHKKNRITLRVWN